MDSRLNSLIDKYWNAETSIEEEKELKELVLASDAEEHEELKALFSHFEVKAEAKLDDAFDQEIMGMIETEPETKVVSFNMYFRRYASVAAAVLVMVVSSVMFMQNQEQYTSEDTFETPEEAYAELKRQLLIVSTYMNKGNETMNELSSLGSANDELAAFGKMSNAESGLEMLGEMNRNN